MGNLCILFVLHYLDCIPHSETMLMSITLLSYFFSVGGARFISVICSPLFNKVPVPSHESERTCICEMEICMENVALLIDRNSLTKYLYAKQTMETYSTCLILYQVYIIELKVLNS